MATVVNRRAGLALRQPADPFTHELLGAGGVPYDPKELIQAPLTRGYDADEPILGTPSPQIIV